MKTYQINTISTSKKKLRDGKKVPSGKAMITVLVGGNGNRRSVTLHVEQRNGSWFGPNPENHAQCVAKNSEAGTTVNKAENMLSLAKSNLSGLNSRAKQRVELQGQIEMMANCPEPERLQKLQARFNALRPVSEEDLDRAVTAVEEAETSWAQAKLSAHDISEQYPVNVYFE